MNITLKMDPVPKGRPRMTRTGIAYTPTKTKDAEKLIKALIAGQPRFAPDVPLRVIVAFCFMRPKSSKKRLYPPGDVDNYTKLLLDGLQGENGIIPDDKQVVDLRAVKRYTEYTESRIEIIIEEIE